MPGQASAAAVDTASRIDGYQHDQSCRNQRVRAGIIDAPFKDETQALGFWDAILGSFHLRPGSV